MIGIYMVPNDELCNFTNTPIITGFLGVSALVTFYCIIRLNQNAEISASDMAKLKRIYEEFHLSEEDKKRRAAQEESAPHGANCCCFPDRKVQDETETLKSVMTGSDVDNE
jgi:hypothetical protein